MTKILRHEDYTIAWIAVLPIEAEAALGVLDKQHEGQFECVRGDDYLYIGGEINKHNVVIATLPEGQTYGVGSAAALGSHIKARFPNIWFALLVGVAAGLPKLSGSRDIRRGDVLVCIPNKTDVGILQYDLGRDTDDGFILVGRQTETPAMVRSAIGNIRLTKPDPFKNGNAFSEYLTVFQSKVKQDHFLCPSQQQDQLFENTSEGPKPVERPPRDELHRTHVWYGNIGSGNTLLRNNERRDQLRDEYDLIGLEMEAAGIMNVLPTGVIRGVCDYGDAYKNKDWQPYAAAVAAVYAKGLLYTINLRISTQMNTDLCTQRMSDFNDFYNAEENKELRTELHAFLHILQLLKVSFSDLESDNDPSSVEPIAQLLRKHYTRFSYVSSLCVTMFFKELIELFGVHLLLFLYILKQCGSEVPKLLTGADIVLEDVFGEEIRLPYRKYRNWGNFNNFLQERFRWRHGEKYVASGQFRLYDYKGRSLTKAKWERLVPNSKVTMSVIVRLSERNVCGRCFKVEDTQKSGIKECSNCGLIYSRTRPRKTIRSTNMSRVAELPSTNSTEDIDQTSLPGSTLSTRRVRSKNSDSTPGYDRELEYFTRIDFAVSATSEPLSSVIIQLSSLVEWIFRLVNEERHPVSISPPTLARLQWLLRDCYANMQTLIKGSLFGELDNTSFLFSADFDDEACFDIRRKRLVLQHEAITLYRQFHLSGGVLDIPKDLEVLLITIGDRVRRVTESLINRGASAKSSQSYYTPSGDVDQEMPTIVKWTSPGTRVYVTGTFTNWEKKFRLHQNDNGEKATMLNLHPGTHHIKFIVDGEWMVSDSLPSAVDFDNNIVNYIEVMAEQPEDIEENELHSLERTRIREAARILQQANVERYGPFSARERSLLSLIQD